jgi:hypothetical protein
LWRAKTNKELEARKRRQHESTATLMKLLHEDQEADKESASGEGTTLVFGIGLDTIFLLLGGSVALGGAILILCGAYMIDEEEGEPQLYEMVSKGDSAQAGDASYEDEDINDLEAELEDSGDERNGSDSSDEGNGVRTVGHLDAAGESILPQRRAS